MKPLPLVIIVVVLVVVVGIALIRYNTPRLARSREAMQQCVEKQGYALMSAGFAWWPRGPFSNEIARHQPVYRVVVRDSKGSTRTGWVRCIPFSDEAEEKWD